MSGLYKSSKHKEGRRLNAVVFEDKIILTNGVDAPKTWNGRGNKLKTVKPIPVAEHQGRVE
jgi:hypothetical protein